MSNDKSPIDDWSTKINEVVAVSTKLVDSNRGAESDRLVVGSSSKLYTLAEIEKIPGIQDKMKEIAKRLSGLDVQALSSASDCFACGLTSHGTHHLYCPVGGRRSVEQSATPARSNAVYVPPKLSDIEETLAAMEPDCRQPLNAWCAWVLARQAVLLCKKAEALAKSQTTDAADLMRCWNCQTEIRYPLREQRDNPLCLRCVNAGNRVACKRVGEQCEVHDREYVKCVDALHQRNANRETIPKQTFLDWSPVTEQEPGVYLDVLLLRHDCDKSTQAALISSRQGWVCAGGEHYAVHPDDRWMPMPVRDKGIR